MKKENNNELFNSLFINMNSNIIVKGEDIKNIIPKENIKYLKNALKYISPTKLCKLYKSISIVIEEREKDDTLLLAEYHMITYLVYILNSDIIKDTEKKELIDNFTKLYQNTLSNNEINTLSEKEILKIYTYVSKSSKHINDTINIITSFENNNYNANAITKTLEENTNNIMKSYISILENDIKTLEATKSKKKIKEISK